MGSALGSSRWSVQRTLHLDSRQLEFVGNVLLNRRLKSVVGTGLVPSGDGFLSVAAEWWAEFRRSLFGVPLMVNDRTPAADDA